jgi:hypothetical protein
MKIFHCLGSSVLVLLLGWGCLGIVSYAQDQHKRPGLAGYTPSRIEWLALAVNSIAHHRLTGENPYTLDVIQADHETLLIHVRYYPTVNREAMNLDIDSTRKVIMIAAKSYGWDNWVKVREHVELYQPS